MDLQMDLQIEAIITSFSSLVIDESKIIKIQKWFRGCILRLKQLPLIMYKINEYKYWRLALSAAEPFFFT